MREKITWSGVLILCLFLASIIFIDRGGIQTIWKYVVKESDIREVTISYKVYLDTVYTGAVTYLSYEGTKNFTILEKTFSAYGLSAIHETVFEFQRKNGENCKLFVNLQTKREMNALIRCKDGLFPMNAFLMKRNDNHFTVFVAPNQKEADSMARTNTI